MSLHGAHPACASSILSAFTLAIALCAGGCSQNADQETSTLITFGSGNNQANAQPLWATIAQMRPVAWVWVGDAIKPKEPGPAAARVAFDTQRANREYAALSRRSRMLGVWNLDDSAFYEGPAARAAAQQLYLDFLGEPQMSPRRRRAGLYGHQDIGSPPRKIRLILLDCRYLGVKPGPHTDLLGEDQWRWFERTLSESRAAFNFIISPIPVIPEEIHDEKWADYPKSRTRLLRMIANSAASGVAILSGGRLVGELSCLEDKVLPYPLFELTSGGLSHTDFRYSFDPNRHRINETHVGLNFGAAEVLWRPDPKLSLKIVDLRGESVLNTTVVLSSISDPGYRQWLRGPRPAAVD